MIKIRFFSKVQVVLLAVLLSACEKKASDEIDFGTYDNSVYKNVYFGLSTTVPADWSKQDQAEQRKIMQTGQKIMSGDDKNLAAVAKASELHSVSLFAVFKYAQGSPVPFNPSIMAMAENVREYPGIKRGSDYHFHTKQALQSGQLLVTFPKEIYTQQLGGIDFDVMESNMTVSGIVVKQKYYATIMKGYALVFIVSYTTDEEEAALQKVLDTVTFK